MNQFGGRKEDQRAELPLLASTLDEVRQGAGRAFAQVLHTAAEIMTYRYLLAFEVTLLLKATFARVVAMTVVSATVVELLASITHFPGFPHGGPAVQTALGWILVASAVIGFRAHAAQTQACKDYARLLHSLRALSGEIGDLDFSNPLDRKLRCSAYLQKLLATFNVALGQPADDNFSIYSGLLWPQEDGSLVRICQDPYCDYNSKGLLPAGKGAGGAAAATGSMIYVPKVSHAHGIQISDEQTPSPRRVMTLRKNAFHQFGDAPAPFQSLLCIPFSVKITRAERRLRGVLYLGSTSIGAFGTEFHLDAAQLEASFVASVLERYFDDSVSTEF